MGRNVKWLVRAGALLIMLGFFMPSMMVSCTAMGMTQPLGEFSLANWAGGNDLRPGDSVLYIVLVGALVAFVSSVISLFRSDWEQYMPWVEAGGIAISLLVLIVAVLNLSSNVAQTGIAIEPRFGAFILGLGYVLALAGVALELATGTSLSASRDYGRVVVPADYPPPAYSPSPELPAPGSLAMARLELIGGNFRSPLVQVTGADFSIGRGSSNQLNIPDPKVSRAHARIRFAQGAWFIQDQNSAIGTYVNNQRVQACRLNEGDQLKIGGVTFVFRC